MKVIRGLERHTYEEGLLKSALPIDKMNERDHKRDTENEKRHSIECFFISRKQVNFCLFVAFLNSVCLLHV